MLQTKINANLLLIILAFFFLSFLYFGITTLEVQSLDYNVSIAQSILDGEFWHLNSTDPFIYYPGSSHIFLTMFLFLGIPVNLIGLLAWVCLFFACQKLGKTFGLNRFMAIIFAASMCTTTTVVRTIADQSIDKWLCTWFVLSVVLLERPQRSWKYSLLVGLTLGMLVGSKYSGPLFLLALLPVYGRTLLRYLLPVRFLATGVVFSVVGLFWYIRNFILKGTPYYPANLPFFKGLPVYTLGDWMLWRIPFSYPQAIIPLVDAFLSEYLIWAFSGIVIVWFLVYSFRKKQVIDRKILRVIMVAVTTGLVSLLLPITPTWYVELFHIISDMRYISIFVVMTMLATFLIADKFKMNELLATTALLNAIMVFSFVPYHPEIFIVTGVLFLVVLYYKSSGIVRKINHFLGM